MNRLQAIGFQLWIGFIILCPSLLRAGELPVYQVWNRTLLDDPVRGVEEVQKRLQKLDKNRDIAESLQLILLLSRDANIIDPKAQPSREQVQEALTQAIQLKMHDARLLLQYQLADKTSPQADIDFKAWLQEARDKGLNRTEALLLNSRGFAFFYEGRYAESLQSARDALRALQHEADPDDSDLLTLKNDLASALDYLGDFRKSRALYEEILDVMDRDQGYRYIRAVVAYNFAAMLKDEQDWPLARRLFQSAIDGTKILNESVIHGLSKKGLAEILIKQGHLTDALRLIDETVQTLEPLGILPDAIADCWRLRAKVYVQQMRWADAQEALKKAQIELLANNRKFQSDLALLRASALQGLGDANSATGEARRAATLLQEQMRADRQGEIAKLSVQLGLELEEQKTALLTKENELQAQKLRESALLKQAFVIVCGLSILALLFLGAALILLRQVTRSRRHMKQILDNIEEGLLTINAELQCSTDLSPYMEHLLGIRHALLKDLDVLTLLLNRSTLTDDQKAMLRSVLMACLDEDILSWELNQGNLPQELILDNGQRSLALHWQMLSGRTGRVRFILLAIRDITERRQMLETIHHAQRRAEQLEILSQELFQTDLNRAASFMRSLQQPLDRMQATWARGETSSALDARLLHTWKGNARTLGLHSMAAAIHKVESGEHQSLSEWIAVYQSLLDRLLSLGLSQTAQALSFWQLIDETERDFKRQLEENDLNFGGIVCENSFESWNESQLGLLRIVLVHGISNAIDHGFVRPRGRGEKVSDTVRIRLRAEATADRLHVELEDNGIGLNQDKLRQLAQSRGFVPTAEQTFLDVLFLDGVTTSDTLSATSGRGIGLAAIQQGAQDYGGHCLIRPATAQNGTRLLIDIPLAPAVSMPSGF